MTDAPVVVCDPGVDDFLALLVLTGSGARPSAVIGTAGNVDAELATRNALRIVAALGLDCPVAKGAESALCGPYPDTGDPFHGLDGLGGIASELPDGTSPGPSGDPLSAVSGSILATGALTVVALAADAGRQIDEVVWMGGAVACGGNMTPAAEFNAWLDPEAADQVLSSGVPVAMIPLDVTHQLHFDPSDLSDLAHLGDFGRLASKACSHFHAQGFEAVPHDAIAAVALLNPELFDWEDRWVRCELTGTLTRGTTVVDRRPQGQRGSVRVAMGMDVNAVKERFFEAIGALG